MFKNAHDMKLGERRMREADIGPNESSFLFFREQFDGSDYGAEQLGVSRISCTIHPTQDFERFPRVLYKAGLEDEF
jgi:hypothetical protein